MLAARLGPGAVGLLVLADGRFPAGTYAHSLGLEEAVAQGRVRELADVTAFATGLLHTTGRVGAGLAVAAWRLAMAGADGPLWRLLDVECDARMPSPAQRLTSRRLGRQLWRTAARLPLGTTGRATVAPPDRLGAGDAGPHQPVALGAVCARLGGSDLDAALLAALGAASVVVHAAVRLLALDPADAAAAVAGLGPQIDRVAAEAVATVAAAAARVPAGDASAVRAPGVAAGLAAALAAAPAGGAPLLEHYAEVHARREWTLFAS